MKKLALLPIFLLATPTWSCDSFSSWRPAQTVTYSSWNQVQSCQSTRAMFQCQSVPVICEPTITYQPAVVCQPSVTYPSIKAAPEIIIEQAPVKEPQIIEIDPVPVEPVESAPQVSFAPPPPVVDDRDFQKPVEIMLADKSPPLPINDKPFRLIPERPKEVMLASVD